MILLLYVDDIVLVGNDKGLVIIINEWLSCNFEIKDILV